MKKEHLHKDSFVKSETNTVSNQHELEEIISYNFFAFICVRVLV